MNWEANSTSFFAQRPLAAISRARRVAREGFRQQPLPDSPENWWALFEWRPKSLLDVPGWSEGKLRGFAA